MDTKAFTDKVGPKTRGNFYHIDKLDDQMGRERGSS